MYKMKIDKAGTEINKEACIDMLKKYDEIEITKIDETEMPTYCAEVFFNSNKDYWHIREVIDSFRSRGFYMMLVTGTTKVNSIIISNLYE